MSALCSVCHDTRYGCRCPPGVGWGPPVPPVEALPRCRHCGELRAHPHTPLCGRPSCARKEARLPRVDSQSGSNYDPDHPPWIEMTCTGQRYRFTLRQTRQNIHNSQMLRQRLAAARIEVCNLADLSKPCATILVFAQGFGVKVHTDEGRLAAQPRRWLRAWSEKWAGQPWWR